MAYCTAAQVKTYAGVSGSGDDSLIGDLITRAQATIDKYVGFTFEAASDTDRTFDAVKDVEGQTLFLDYPLASLNSVTNGDGNSIATNVIITEPPNETPYYALTIRSDQSTYWTYGDYSENAITINGEWAWSASAPNDIVHACVRLATFLYRQKDSSTDLDRPLLTNDGVTILPSQVPNDVRQILDVYARTVMR